MNTPKHILRLAPLAFLCAACCCSSAQATVVFTVTDAGAGNTSWSISGSGVGVPFDQFSPVAEVIVPTYFGNFSFVSGGTNITGTGNWTIGGVPVMRSFWVGEGGLDGLNDFLVIDFSTSVASPLDLSTASGSVVFPIPISSFTNPSYVGTSIDAGGQPAFNVGSAFINIPSVPEPSTATLGLVAVAALLSRRSRNDRNG